MSLRRRAVQTHGEGLVGRQAEPRATIDGLESLMKTDSRG